MLKSLYSRLSYERILVITLLLYTALAALYPLWLGLFRPRHTWAMQQGASALGLIAHACIYLALFGAYLVAIRMEPNRFSTRQIVLGWLLFSVVCLFTFPGESADIFDYLFRGRMMTEYGRSPLNTTPFELGDFPFHRYVSWSQWVDAYGPVWEYASAGVSWLVRATASPADLAVVNNQVCQTQIGVCVYLAKYVTAYRLLSVLLTGGCAWLISVLASESRREPQLAPRRALLLFLWNPLVIISTAIGAHNDVLMVLFVLLAALAFQRGRWLLGLLALFVAVHVKLTAIVMLPVFVLWLARRAGWLRATAWTVSALLLVLPLSWLLYAPLGGWATLPKNLHERSLLATNSLGEALLLVMQYGRGWTRFEAMQIVSRAAPLAFAVVAGLVLLVWLRRKDEGVTSEEALSIWVQRGAWIVVLYLLIGSYWFQAWYGVWPLALAAVLPAPKPTRHSRAFYIVLGLGFAALLMGVVSDYLRNMNPAPLPGWQVSALVIGGLWVAVLAAALFRRGETGTTA